MSVLIPTYRRPELLREAIASVLAQSYADLEVVVGDDGALGGDVVTGLGDRRVHYRRHPARLGMVGNWSWLLDNARGAYLALLMDDDRWEPGFLDRCVAVLDADPATGVVFTNHWFESPERKWLRECALRGGRHDHFAAAYVRTMPVGISAALFRREVWEDVRPLPDTAASDTVMFGRAAERGWRFHYVDEPLMTYRWHDDNFSSTRGFAHDVAAAWDALSFSDPEAESLRRTHLADSLLTRAAAYLRAGDPRAAAEDVRRAATLGPTSPRRATVLGLLARAPFAARPVLALADRASWRPWQSP